MREKLLTSRFGPIAALLCNLALAYVLYFVARVVYLLENYSILSQGLDWHRLLSVLGGGLVFDTSAIMYTLALYVLLMLLPLHLKERRGYHKACKWIYVVINALCLAVNLMDAVYFQYTSRRTTSTVFGEFSHEGNLASVLGTELLRHWYLVLVFVALVWLLHRFTVVPKLTVSRARSWRYYAIMVAALVAMIPAVIGGMRGGLAHAVRPITVSNAHQYVDRPVHAALVLNTPFSLLRTLGKNVFSNPHYYASEAELEAAYSPIHHPADSAHFTAKNVVVIIVESFGKEYTGFFNHELDGGRYRGYTPFLDSLLQQSLTFKYSYANGRKSIDAMPSVLSGIPMMVEPFFVTPASMNNLSGLARELGGKGYTTAFLHGAQNGSMGFQAFARATGFQQYLGRTEYDADPTTDGDRDFDGMWAIWDDPFLQFMARKLGGMKQPFMATVFTASSHHPFKVPAELEKQLPDEGGQPIHKCVRYTDMALRHFFESASQQPWFNNTIFVITADHTNQSSHAEYKTDLGLYSIPIAFYAPDGSIAPALRDDVVMQQASVMPTLLGMLGYDSDYLAFGCDVLSTPASSTWAFSYNSGIYQLVQGEWLMQHDGNHVTAMYRYRTDTLLRHNLAGKAGSEQAAMERLLKGIVQQYMTRMSDDRLMVR